MSRIAELCRHVRSKNAGPFWITIDLFFKDEATYRKYRDAATLGPQLFARLYGTDPRQVKRFAVDALRMVKISFCRPHPQGWAGERDMHAGQQYVRLLQEDIG